jgi:hydrogenase expression/formation protein HypC
MCLGIPGRVAVTWGEGAERMATVQFGGISKEVCLAYVPDVQVGDYTIVHVGFALTRLDEASALETLALFDSLGLITEELLPPGLEPVAGSPTAAETPAVAS